MFVQLDDSSVLYRQVYDSVRRAILEGRLPARERLPSTRSLAMELGVSRRTVLLAYDQLLAEGYIVGKVGSGTFVAPELPDSPFLGPSSDKRAATRSAPPRLSRYNRRLVSNPPVPPPGWTLDREPLRYDFSYGQPAVDWFPQDVWRRLIVRSLRTPSLGLLGFTPPEGFAPLREAIAKYLRHARGVDCTPDEVLIVGGSQQALDLAARVLLDPGDRVALEEPHYQGARQIFLAAGAKLIGLPVDAEGLVVSEVAVRARGARLMYITPSHQFPTGATLPLPRRLTLLEWAERADAYLLEDDYDSEFRYSGRPVAAIRGLDRAGRVIYIGTFSKVLFPALRVGYLVLPPVLVRPFIAAKFLADRHTPTLEQQVLADFIKEGHFERHVRRSRTRAAARRAALLLALRDHLGDRVSVSGADAGLHTLVWFRDVPNTRIPGLVQRAAAAGVGVYSVAPYYLKPPRRGGLLLGYASLNERAIRQGICILASVL